jgi:hypothetical protein
VNVLFALSATLGEVFSPAKAVFAGLGILLSVCILLNKILCAIVTAPSLRQLKMLEQAKIL